MMEYMRMVMTRQTAEQASRIGYTVNLHNDNQVTGFGYTVDFRHNN